MGSNPIARSSFFKNFRYLYLRTLPRRRAFSVWFPHGVHRGGALQRGLSHFRRFKGAPGQAKTRWSASAKSSSVVARGALRMGKILSRISCSLSIWTIGRYLGWRACPGPPSLAPTNSFECFYDFRGFRRSCCLMRSLSASVSGRTKSRWSTSSACANSKIVTTAGFRSPRSKSLRYCWEKPETSANRSCVHVRSSLIRLTFRPTSRRISIAAGLALYIL